MPGIPPTIRTDTEDVAWALQTAEALWKRHERADAVVWLRRAAQAAGDAEDDDRALALARNAAELAEWMTRNPFTASRRPPPEPSESSAGVDALLGPGTEIGEPGIEAPLQVDEELELGEDAEIGDDEIVDEEIPEPAAAAEFAPAFAPEASTDRGTADVYAHDVEPGVLYDEARAPVEEDGEDEVTSPHSGSTPPSSPPSSIPPEPAVRRSPRPQVAMRSLVMTMPLPPPMASAESVVMPLAPPLLPPPVMPPVRTLPPPTPTLTFPAPLLTPSSPLSPSPSHAPASPTAPAPPPVITSVPPPPSPVITSVPPPPSPVPPPPTSPVPPPLVSSVPPPPVITSVPPPPASLVPPPPEAEASARVPTAAEAHAGMLDPWADAEGAEPPPPPRAASPSVRMAAAPRAAATTAVTATVHTHETDEVVTSAPPVTKPKDKKAVASKPPMVPPPEPPAPPPRTPPPARPPLHPPPVDLSTVEALSDLPDDAREAFARQASIHDLRRNDEIANFALALVLEGSVEVTATIVDSPAQRLDAGAVLRGRGTIDAIESMRLVSAADHTRVATWGERDVNEAFRSCPWVEDELRVAGNRMQALVGVTMGPLGERLDPVLRANVTNRMRLRVLAEHEVFANAGAPIPGLLVVGAGELELLGRNGAPIGRVLRAGDFLFPSEVLRAAPAPNSVRAAKGGALILVAERGVAQELLVTCPPLLELFAEG